MQPMTSHSSVITFHQAEGGGRSRWSKMLGFGLVPVDYGNTLPKARMLKKRSGSVALIYPESMSFVRIKNMANPKRTEY